MRHVPLHHLLQFPSAIVVRLLLASNIPASPQKQPLVRHTHWPLPPFPQQPSDRGFRRSPSSQPAQVQHQGDWASHAYSRDLARQLPSQPSPNTLPAHGQILPHSPVAAGSQHTINLTSPLHSHPPHARHHAPSCNLTPVHPTRTAAPTTPALPAGRPRRFRPLCFTPDSVAYTYASS
jgi:hypothetical protein